MTEFFSTNNYSIFSNQRPCFAWFSQRTTIIFRCCINWLYFSMEMESVRCDVRNEPWNKFQLKREFKHCEKCV